MKKLLPPRLFLLSIITMVAFHWGLVTPRWHGPLPKVMGLVLLISGLVLAIAGKRQFRRVGTNVSTFNEPDVLVTSGIYRYSRNPMYVGLVVALGGIAAFLGGLLSALVVVVFAVIIDRWYIVYEERRLRDVFGERYLAYCGSTRRWV